MSTRSRRDYVHQIFARQTEIALANLERIHRTIGDMVDVVFLCGTDFGTQTSAFCSVPTFRELWLPYYRQICGWIHAHTTWKCFKHSCGSVERFYESFLEAGFDIVNPVQCSAVGMDPALLKAKHGDRLTFWGGGIDTQKTLPFGTPAEVREQVLRRCEIFAPGGGFVFNAIHNIQAGTPVANIVALFEAVRAFNGANQGVST
jgi:uroporphyrinogen-III decarboxylase